MKFETASAAVRGAMSGPRSALATATGLLLAFAAGGASTGAGAAVDSFQALMEAAMQRMHAAMAAPGTGDPDRDFAAMMIPHHQGAVDMAEIQLRFGKDERLRRLAQGIIVEQQQEIAVMRQVLETPPPPSPSARGHPHTHSERNAR